MDKQKHNQKQPDAAKTRATEESGNEMPTFDEGGPRPSPIESTTDDGVRTPIATSPAGEPDEHPEAEGTHTDATMAPGEGRDPKRNTM